MLRIEEVNSMGLILIVYVVSKYLRANINIERR